MIKMDYTVPTPALIVDWKKVKNNAEDMLNRAKKFGVQLRPHFKTGKEAKIAELQTGGTKRGMVVSTLAEAEYLINNGFDDILYGVALTPDKLERFQNLSSQINELHCMVDNKEILELMFKKFILNKKIWSVFIDVDPGYHRSGVSDKSLILMLAKALSTNEQSTFRGIYVHCGHSYNAKSVKQIEDVGEKVVSYILDIKESLENEGIQVNDYGLGSTPTCSCPHESLSKVTEWHPGNYIFYDVMQEKIGSCTRGQIACFVLTRVKGHYTDGGDRMGIDCGWTALTMQGFGKFQEGGFGCVDGHPELKLVSMSQEHGIIKAVDGGNIDFYKYPVGSCLKILPYHSCATAAMHHVYYVLNEDNTIEEKLFPVKGW